MSDYLPCPITVCAHFHAIKETETFCISQFFFLSLEEYKKQSIILLQTGRPAPATPSGRTHDVTCNTTLPFFYSLFISMSLILIHSSLYYMLPLRKSSSLLYFFFFYYAFFPPSDTTISSSLAAREDEEVPRGGSHKPRDVPCG